MLEKTLSTRGLQKAYENINNGARFTQNGIWSIALGGYDTGYIIYLQQFQQKKEIFRVNYSYKEFEILDCSISETLIEKIKRIMECQFFAEYSEE